MIKNQERYLSDAVKDDLKERMVFIGGPRQMGKTTFSLMFLPDATEKHPAYLNWDHSFARASLLKGELPPDQRILILDEIHKFSRWRNLVKGYYDTHNNLSPLGKFVTVHLGP
jgi:uncharacterized protein